MFHSASLWCFIYKTVTFGIHSLAYVHILYKYCTYDKENRGVNSRKTGQLRKKKNPYTNLLYATQRTLNITRTPLMLVTSFRKKTYLCTLKSASIMLLTIIN